MKELTLQRWQLDLTWALAEVHLADLTTEDCLWEPATLCWTVHQEDDGRWFPDWQVPEPEPVPVPTIGWLTWHLGWWWGTAADHLVGRDIRNRTDVAWPGDAESTVQWLHVLHEEWAEVLDTLTEEKLDKPSAFPWQAESGLTKAHTVAWVNAELMKNVAEIGNLRLLRAAT
ncbi:DinB family protein [Jannaschia sp. R86511]|uniref:DinB family protein n=1 Tax=Jannaschia sp. R86511 TaxID=3093853 RepID=UPI0036D2AAB3